VNGPSLISESPRAELSEGASRISSLVPGALLKADPPKRHFCRKVYRSMANREADYVKKGDTMRAEAMKDLRNSFERSRFASQLIA